MVHKIMLHFTTKGILDVMEKKSVRYLSKC